VLGLATLKGNMKEQMTTVLLPKGEWLDSLLVAFQVAELELASKPRGYEYTFVNQALPIVFQAVRSKEVIDAVYDWDTRVNAGFTGTDIAAEQRVSAQADRSWEFPLERLNPKAPKPKVYFGSTPNLRTRANEPTLLDLEGTTIYTEYPFLASTALSDAGVSARIKAVQGGSEGRWRIDERNGAVVTIRNTDETMRANEIEPMLDILSAAILYVEGAGISPQDKLRVDDLREALYQALARVALPA